MRFCPSTQRSSTICTAQLLDPTPQLLTPDP